jgi:poly(hydroxyalkanoate) depolymerase family esterase
MVKSAYPWLRGLLRAGKKQQRVVARAVKGVVKDLLATPKSAVKPRAKPKAKAAPKLVKARVRAPAAPRKQAERPVAPTPPAPGKWMASYYSGLSEQGGLTMRRMHYWLYLPEAPAPASFLASALTPAVGAAPAAPPPMPLIVMLHGCDQSATQFAEGTRMNQVAGRLGYAVVYPQQSIGSHPHRCWKWYDRATQQGGGDVGMITGIVHKVMERYRIDRSRIYICGMSAGAGMANIVALNHPELFAALGLHSGPVFGAGHSAIGALTVMQRGAGLRADGAIADALQRHPEGVTGLPTMLIQGEADTVVRPVNQVELARQAMLVNQLPAGSVEEVVHKPAGRGGYAYQVRDVYRKRKVMLRVARIAELPHAWSGGDARLAYNSAQGPDASKMLVSFFARHRRTD